MPHEEPRPWKTEEEIVLIIQRTVQPMLGAYQVAISDRLTKQDLSLEKISFGLQKVEGGLKEAALRKEVLKELLDEQEQQRVQREHANKRRIDRFALFFKVIGGPTLTYMAAKFAYTAWTTHTLFPIGR